MAEPTNLGQEKYMPEDNHMTLRNGTRIKQISPAETTNLCAPNSKKARLNTNNKNIAVDLDANKLIYQTDINYHNKGEDEKPAASKEPNDKGKGSPLEFKEPLGVEHNGDCTMKSSGVNDAPLTKIKASKLGSYCVRIAEDTEEFCAIQGMSVAPDGRRLLVDSCNRKIKLFSKYMELLDCIKTRGQTLSIACLSNEEAAVITRQKSLMILDISHERMSIKSAGAVLETGLWNIAKCGNSFAITYPFYFRQLKCMHVALVDRQGKVIWVGCKELLKQGTMSLPISVACFEDLDEPIVFVADSHMHKLIAMNGDTGKYINERHILGPGCLAAAPFGIFSTSLSGVILVAHDLSQEKILLSMPEDIEWGPQAMAYDNSNHQLIISYTGHVGNAYHCNYIDCFQIYPGQSPDDR